MESAITLWNLLRRLSLRVCAPASLLRLQLDGNGITPSTRCPHMSRWGMRPVACPTSLSRAFLTRPAVDFPQGYEAVRIMTPVRSKFTFDPRHWGGDSQVSVSEFSGQGSQPLKQSVRPASASMLDCIAPAADIYVRHVQLFAFWPGRGAVGPVEALQCREPAKPAFRKGCCVSCRRRRSRRWTACLPWTAI